jgi:hypothetical protein
MVLIMKVPILPWIAAVIISGCHAQQQPENRHKLADEGDRALFISELKKHGIPARVDSEGGVWYPAAQEEKVDQILEGTLTSRSGGVSFPDPNDRMAFENALRAASIPYEIRTRLGMTWIVWDSRHDKEVLAMKEKIENGTIGRGTR